MKIFCRGELPAPSLLKVQFAEDKECWDGNLKHHHGTNFQSNVFAFTFIMMLCLQNVQNSIAEEVYYGVDDSFRGLAPHIVELLLGSYNAQIPLRVFMAIVSLLLASFFGYHANHCLTNTAMNETFKWQDYLSWQKKWSEARASVAALKASITRMSSDGKPSETKCKSFFRRSPLEDTEGVVKNNVYDNGFFHNFFEVVCPVSTRASFLQTKAKFG
ncbi:probable protein S-acyltransferase 17 [Durio zibethinus]|uniref:Probable protein S-acyltransferase 17 n=1 Tax=Durio zibethinus TaxID=66656 RepID=A0A6P5X5U9_DURZI|nr:probable protein S-acyltransferase 17 [Durio zibethinus]